MEREFRRFQDGKTEFVFLDYGLHRTPEQMGQAIQREIEKVSSQPYEGIVLGYGLCSNGIVGVSSTFHPLIIPKVHDCISLFLGSVESYQRQSKEHPGTYYLTPGWIEKGQTPISKYESYEKAYGKETARWVLNEEMKHYTRIVFIDTGVYPPDPYRAVARQNAEFLGISFEELKGSPDLFRKLVQGPWDRDFLLIRPHQTVEQEMFFDL
ncbi:MAG: DUF1638 domain-containing protein [Desulfobacterota bacterium]|nr:DUF1638 domain-containing protein [Thermodesulfobacteriota bacterium]